jgi:hypothetical protein
MPSTTINARIFEALNANPHATIEELKKGDKQSTVSAVRNFWRQTRHKTYRATSTVSNPVQTAREILATSAKRGLSETESRDLAIDAGVAHGTAFSVAAEVFRDFRRHQKTLREKLKGALGRWTVVVADSGLELPVGHNIRVDWTQDPPRYHDPLKKRSKKYERWIAAFESGYAVIQKGKVVDGIETRTRESYLGIYRIDQLEIVPARDGETVDVTFRMVEELPEVPAGLS